MAERGPGPALTYIVEMVPKWAPWMSKNLLLALVPLLLALLLFRQAQRRTPLWWLGAIAFVAFLPNAPYVLADYRWLVGPWRNAWYHDRWRFVPILPVWMLYFGVGFGVFVVSVRLAQRYIAREWSDLLGRVAVVALTAACAVGLYLGRSDFNSWSIAAEPGAVSEALTVLPTTDNAAENVALAFAGLLLGYVTVIFAAGRVRSAWAVRRQRQEDNRTTGSSPAAPEVKPA